MLFDKIFNLEGFLLDLNQNYYGFGMDLHTDQMIRNIVRYGLQNFHTEEMFITFISEMCDTNTGTVRKYLKERRPE